MDKKKLLTKLQKEQKDLGQRIMALSNSLYFDDDMPAKDLVREQLQAMDKYFEALEARITDLDYDILMDESLDPEFKKALDEAEEAKNKKAEPNFLDDMFGDLNIDLEDMLTDLRKRIHDLEDMLTDLRKRIHDLEDKLTDLRKRIHDLEDKRSSVVSMEDMEGKRIINVNPPHCHECENDGKGCHKLCMVGNQHICVK